MKLVKLLTIFSLISLSYSYSCFTMPPKVSLNYGKYNIPDLSDEKYVHDTFECPSGYITDKKYTNIIENMNDSFYIYSYNVCCQGGMMYNLNTLLSC